MVAEFLLNIPSGYVKIAIENGHLWLIFPWKMVIFHSFWYVYQRVSKNQMSSEDCGLFYRRGKSFHAFGGQVQVSSPVPHRYRFTVDASQLAVGNHYKARGISWGSQDPWTRKVREGNLGREEAPKTREVSDTATFMDPDWLNFGGIFVTS